MDLFSEDIFGNSEVKMMETKTMQTKAKSISQFGISNLIKINLETEENDDENSETDLQNNCQKNSENNLKNGISPKDLKSEKQNENKNESDSDDFIEIISINSDFDPKNKAKSLIDKINWAATQRKTELVGEILSLTNHPSVAVRRKIAESVSKIGNKEIIKKLQDWHQNESDRQTLILIQTSIDKLDRRNDFEVDKHILTVSEAIVTLKSLIGKQSYQIEGELSEVRNFGSMIYFGIKDKQDSRLDCSCFSGILSRCKIVMNEGWSVRITGKFKLGKYSKIAIDVTHIELTGQGALLQNLKDLEQKLEKEGLFDINRKRKLNILPTRILLIASLNSAALTDFVKVLADRRSGITIFHQNIKTQGIGAESEIINVLEKTNDLIDLYGIDTVVMTRGGGSADDLFVFNSEKIIRSLHGIKVPTIVAIGHERDTTLAEKAADLRASTPSNAAELVSLSNLEIKNVLNQTDLICQNYFGEKSSQYSQLSQRIFQIIVKNTEYQIQNANQICQNTNNLIFEVMKGLRKKLDYTDILGSQLLQETKNKLQQTDFLWQRIITQIQKEISENQNKVQILGHQLEIENPDKILAKGYAIIKQNNTIITQIKEIQTGKNNQITIQMLDGTKEIQV